MTYEMYEKVGQWRWRLKAGNGKIIADSAEGYNNKKDCEGGITLVKGSANAPVKEVAS